MGFRAGLKDLVLWVAGVAIFSGVLRRAWGPWTLSPRPLGGPPSGIGGLEYRVLGLATLALAVGLGVRLAAQVVRRARHAFDATSPGPRPDPGALGGAIAWRSLAIALLVAYAAEESRLLRIDLADPGQTRPVGSWTIEARLKSTPICGLLLMIGLLVGMGRSTIASAGRPKARWWVAPLAGLVGLGMATAYMVIPYLVLIALEAVAYATRHRPHDGAGLALRVARAAPDAALAVAACVGTAIWIARDLRRAAREGPEETAPRGWRPLLLRSASLAAAVATSGYLLLVTIPALHEWLAEGIGETAGPGGIAVIATGFAGLAAGIAARAVGRVPGPEILPGRPGFAHVLFQTAGCLLGLGVTFAAISVIFRERSLSWMSSPTLDDWAASAARAWDLAWGSDLPVHLWAPAATWAAAEAVRLCGPQAPDRAAAFDAVASSGPRLARFLGLWAALTTLCLCALPTFFVTGLALYQFRLMGPNWP